MIAVTPNSCSIDSAARPGRPGVAMTRGRLMETATKKSPVSVAAISLQAEA
jgi:hypothetical protein